MNESNHTSDDDYRDEDTLPGMTACECRHPGYLAGILIIVGDRVRQQAAHLVRQAHGGIGDHVDSRAQLCPEHRRAIDELSDKLFRAADALRTIAAELS